MIHKIDVTKEHCPMTYVKVKLALARMQTDDFLEVMLSEGEPLRSVPKSAKEQGYEVGEATPVTPGIYKITIGLKSN